MPNRKLESSINAVVGVGVARLAYWGGEQLALPFAISVGLALATAAAAGWLLGLLRNKRIIEKPSKL